MESILEWITSIHFSVIIVHIYSFAQNMIRWQYMNHMIILTEKNIYLQANKCNFYTYQTSKGVSKDVPNML